MATITAHISIIKTTSTLDAATIALIIAWVKTNVIDKIPQDCTLNVSYGIIP